MKCTRCDVEIRSLDEAKKPCLKPPPSTCPEDIGHSLLFGDYMDLRKREEPPPGEISMAKIGTDRWWTWEERHGRHGIVHAICDLLWNHKISPRKADELIEELFNGTNGKCPPAPWDEVEWES